MDRKNKGFTLVELIIVVAVLAILVGILSPSYTKYVKKSKVAACAAQREEIERVYQVACIDHPQLASVKDTTELSVLLEGKNLLVYLAEEGYIDQENPKCPVYDENYDLEVSSGRLEVLCSCVDGTKGYLARAEKLFVDNNYVNWTDRKELIKIMAKQGFLQVPKSILQKTHFEDKELYWRPYHLADGKMILYASTYTNKTDPWEYWRGYCLYINGAVYQSTNKNGDKYDPVQLNKLYDYSEDNIDTFLKEKGFEKVS